MKRFINRAALAKTTYHSAHISVLSYQGLQVTEEGTYIGHLTANGATIKQVKIHCTEEAEGYQVTLDLARLDQRSQNDCAPDAYMIRPKGYILLLDSEGDSKARFQLEKIGKSQKPTLVKDTHTLSEGDVYACTLLRPGNYSLTVNGKKAATIEVVYPTAKTPRDKVQEPVRVSLGKKYKKKISVLPMQGLVFDFSEKGQIEIKLEKAEASRGLVEAQAKEYKQRKKKTMKPKTYHWRNPKYATRQR